MKKDKFTAIYEKRNVSKEEIAAAIMYVEDFEKFMENDSKEIDTADIVDIKFYMQYLIEKEENSLQRIIALARYFYAIDKKKIYVYFTGLL